MNYRPEYDMKVVGRNLKRLRRANHLSVDDVREYLCLGSVQAVYKYEKGESYPQADTMFALMELYGATLYDIVRNHEEDEKSSSVISMNFKTFKEAENEGNRKHSLDNLRRLFQRARMAYGRRSLVHHHCGYPCWSAVL